MLVTFLKSFLIPQDAWLIVNLTRFKMSVGDVSLDLSVKVCINRIN